MSWLAELGGRVLQLFTHIKILGPNCRVGSCLCADPSSAVWSATPPGHYQARHTTAWWEWRRAAGCFTLPALMFFLNKNSVWKYKQKIVYLK
jgi:hypothetical protein